MSENEKRDFLKMLRFLGWLALAAVSCLIGAIFGICGFGGFIYGLGTAFLSNFWAGVGYMLAGGLACVFAGCLILVGSYIWMLTESKGEEE